MGDFIRSTQEYQNWGVNWLTASAFGTVLFSLVQSWGLYEQAKTIHHERSGASVSVILYSFFASFFLAFCCYGFAIKSIAIVFNGLVGACYLPVLFGLWRFKGFTLLETILSASFTLMIPSMILSPAKELLLMIFMSCSLLPLANQGWEIIKNRSTGALDIRLVLAFTLSTIFWIVYAYAINDPVMKIVNPCALVILLITFALWFRYRDNEPAIQSTVIN